MQSKNPDLKGTNQAIDRKLQKKLELSRALTHDMRDHKGVNYVQDGVKEKFPPDHQNQKTHKQQTPTEMVKDSMNQVKDKITDLAHKVAE